MKSVSIRCTGLKNLPRSEIQAFQGDLKVLSDESYIRFKTQLLELGFSEPISVWENDGKVFCLNGHQRLTTLSKMAEEGFDIPNEIPVNIVLADDIVEAKKKVLALASQYGDVTSQGLYDFMLENNFSMDDIKSSFDFPELNLLKFEEGYFGLPSGNESATEAKNSEISEGEFSKLVHTCPSCGHQFARE